MDLFEPFVLGEVSSQRPWHSGSGELGARLDCSATFFQLTRHLAQRTWRPSNRNRRAHLPPPRNARHTARWNLALIGLVAPRAALSKWACSARLTSARQIYLPAQKKTPIRHSAASGVRTAVRPNQPNDARPPVAISVVPAIGRAVAVGRAGAIVVFAPLPPTV